MARLNRHRVRHGWTRTGVRFGLVLLVLLWTTGVLLGLWPADAVFQLESWKASLRHASAVVHGTLTWFACVAAGRWIWPHVAQLWAHRAAQRWWLGLLSVTLTACIAVTGLALLYGPADWHDAIGQWHWWIAVAWPVLVLVHALPRRRRAAASH